MKMSKIRKQPSLLMVSLIILSYFGSIKSFLEFYKGRVNRIVYGRVSIAQSSSESEYSARNVVERTNFQLQEYYWVTPIGLNMEILISEAEQSSQNDVSTEVVTRQRQGLPMRLLGWFKKEKKTDKSPANVKRKPPLLFIHGSFHSAWCFAEHFMPYFTKLGHDCYAVSLRGTAATGMPPNVPGESVKISEHVEDLSYCLDTIVSRYEEKEVQVDSPIIIGHSVGGLMVLKMLELESIRRKISGAALLCSVPPSGNAAMVGRFFKRDLWQVIRIVWGLVFKKVTTSISVCRDVFFDKTVPEKDIILYMKRFQLDSRVGLDLRDLTQVLPSITCMDQDGRASWLKNVPFNGSVSNAPPTPNCIQQDQAVGGVMLDNDLVGEPGVIDSFGNRIPARLVIGAEKDYIVDFEGVQESAKYLGISKGPVIVPDHYHDVMLGPKWKRTAKIIRNWIDTTILANNEVLP